jgi:His-Xaa-Ser system protein HxsD
MIPQNHICDGKIIVFADNSLFTKEAVFKCLYWYGDRFHVTVSQVEVFFQIELTPQNGQEWQMTELEMYRQKLERDLIDFNLRDIVTKETRNVRDLLIAKAFSNGEFDEVPPGSISDPVGFQINGQA